MNIVVADRLPAPFVDRLRALAGSLVEDPSLGGDRLAEACSDAEVLVVRSTAVPAEVLGVMVQAL